MASITRFYALILSTVLMLTGVPGFFPNVESFQPLVAFFALTLVHSVVHVAVGLLGLLITALASDDSVRVYTLGAALLYGALTAVGVAHIDFAPVIHFNNADNWLHGAIFVLSLGVFLVGLTDERLNRRKARVIDDLPTGRWAVPSAPVGDIGGMGAEARRSQMPRPASGVTPAGIESPWYNSPQQEPQTSWRQGAQSQQPQQPQQEPWGQSAWQQNQQPPRQPSYQPPYQPPYQSRPAQPPSQPQPQPQPQKQQSQSQSQSQPRDPWTREQRHAPYPRSSNPASSPAEDQQPDPWAQSKSPWSPWSQESQPKDRQPAQQPQEQWPLDEWPSLNNPRPTQ